MDLKQPRIEAGADGIDNVFEVARVFHGFAVPEPATVDGDVYPVHTPFFLDYEQMIIPNTCFSVGQEVLHDLILATSRYKRFGFGIPRNCYGSKGARRTTAINMSW